MNHEEYSYRKGWITRAFMVAEGIWEGNEHDEGSFGDEMKRKASDLALRAMIAEDVLEKRRAQPE